MFIAPCVLSQRLRHFTARDRLVKVLVSCVFYFVDSILFLRTAAAMWQSLAELPVCFFPGEQEKLTRGQCVFRVSAHRDFLEWSRHGEVGRKCCVQSLCVRWLEMCEC